MMNFTGRPAKVSLPEGTDALTGENIGGVPNCPSTTSGSSAQFRNNTELYNSIKAL